MLNLTTLFVLLQELSFLEDDSTPAGNLKNPSNFLFRCLLFCIIQIFLFLLAHEIPYSPFDLEKIILVPNAVSLIQIIILNIVEINHHCLSRSTRNSRSWLLFKKRKWNSWNQHLICENKVAHLLNVIFLKNTHTHTYIFKNDPYMKFVKTYLQGRGSIPNNKVVSYPNIKWQIGRT